MPNSREKFGLGCTLGRAVAAAWLARLGLLSCSVYDASLVSARGSLAGSDAGGSSQGAAGSNQPAGGAGAGASAGGTSAAGGAAGPAIGGSPGGAAAAGASASGGVAGGGASAFSGELLDDMEDSDAQVALAMNRDGFWYTGNDLTPGGAQTPPPEAFRMFELGGAARPGSSWSAYMAGSGFTVWGAVLGLNVDQSAEQVLAYDASAFCGVRFWAKAGESSAKQVRVRLPDGSTHPAGNTCSADASGPANQLCWDHFGKTLLLASDWQQRSVLFSELAQAGAGYSPADHLFDRTRLFAIEWTVAQNQTFELWIDDVELLAKPAGGACP